MRLGAALGLSLAGNLAVWPLFGFWLGSTSAQPPRGPVELSVTTERLVRPPRPRSLSQPPRVRPAAEPRPAPVAKAQPLRPRFRPIGRPRPRPIAAAAPQPHPKPVAAKEATPPVAAALAKAPDGRHAASPAPPTASTAGTPAAVRPRRVSASPAPSAADLSALRGRIRAAVQQQRRYPRLARRRGLEGKVVVAFRLAKNGSLKSLRILRSAGDVLDRAALAAVRQAAPLPYYPDVVRVPFVFELDD